MPVENTYLVLPDPFRGGWQVRTSRKHQLHKHFELKDDAVRYAQEIARQDGVPLSVYNEQIGDFEPDWRMDRGRAPHLQVHEDRGGLPHEVVSPRENPYMRGQPRLPD